MSRLDLAPFQALVKQRCGLQFDGDGQAKLAQALQERCAALGLAQEAYLSCLERSAGEFQELVNLLTINETYFFREPEQIRLLVHRLVPRLLARNGGQGRLRILSAGCSTGEEPYSLAIALLEHYGEAAAQWFTLVGADIDSRALARARAATYSDFSFRGVPEALRQRYFERTRQGWRLAPAVRRLVEFHECNLLDPPREPALQGCDVIFFRNVSIYFDLPTRRRIQQHLAQLLKDDGILVIGVAETLANNLGVLPLVEEDGLFYFAQGQPPLLPPASVPEPRPAPSARAAPPPVPPPPLTLPEGWVSAPQRTPGQAALAQARQAVQDKRYAAALPQLDAVLADAPEHTEARLLKAYVLLERKEFDAAMALARAVLEAHAWSVDACMLLGLAAKWSGSADEAMRWFRQAIYAHHACWPAHYFLADLQRAGGALEQARRTWRVVLQLLSGAAPDTGIRHLPLDLPASEIRFLCTRHLAQAGAGAAGPG
ncbi:CheR family methyltransferase [Comamonas granuli]|uniref:CheR family methyltransferase n=1 Tax=Comamonas granuli TaxID=290309 RepID=UPI0005A5E7D3|nr:protein-glutamate O-methyltransferase CheR [Comamonas granuli]